MIRYCSDVRVCECYSFTCFPTMFFPHFCPPPCLLPPRPRGPSHSSPRRARLPVSKIKKMTLGMMKSMYWAAHQRFFRAMCIAFKVRVFLLSFLFSFLFLLVFIFSLEMGHRPPALSQFSGRLQIAHAPHVSLASSAVDHPSNRYRHPLSRPGRMHRPRGVAPALSAEVPAVGGPI